MDGAAERRASKQSSSDVGGMDGWERYWEWQTCSLLDGANEIGTALKGVFQSLMIKYMAHTLIIKL